MAGICEILRNNNKKKKLHQQMEQQRGRQEQWGRSGTSEKQINDLLQIKLVKRSLHCH